MDLRLEIGDFINIMKPAEYDFWNNTYFQPESTGPVYKVHQITQNFITHKFRLALEDITKPGHVDYYSLTEEEIKILPTTKAGEPYSRILMGDN